MLGVGGGGVWGAASIKIISLLRGFCLVKIIKQSFTDYLHVIRPGPEGQL